MIHRPRCTEKSLAYLSAFSPLKVVHRQILTSFASSYVIYLTKINFQELRSDHERQAISRSASLASILGLAGYRDKLNAVRRPGKFFDSLALVTMVGNR